MSYFIGVCGHVMPVLSTGHLVPCPCDKRPDSTVERPDSSDPCPHCGGLRGVRDITTTSPKVRAWSCSECGTCWATGVVNSHLDHLRGSVVLRELITLAELAPRLTDDQLRSRLLVLAERAAGITGDSAPELGARWPR